MSKSISVSDLASLLAAAKTGYVAEILADEEKKALAVEKAGTNAATRKANLVKALIKATKKVKGCSEDLAPAAQAVRDFLPGAKAVAPIAERVIETGKGLDDDEIVLVTKSVVDGKLVKELVDAAYETSKTAIFRTMDEAAAEEGEEFPEHTNVWIDVPDLGKRLSREGAGRKEAELDQDALRDLVGDEVWAQITSEHVVRVVDEEKLAKVALKNKGLLEQVRKATVPGGWKSPRLMVRDIPNE